MEIYKEFAPDPLLMKPKISMVYFVPNCITYKDSVGFVKPMCIMIWVIYHLNELIINKLCG